MKILFAAAVYLPHVGGVERHIEALSEELARDGHQVVVVAEKHDENLKSRDRLGSAEVIRWRRLRCRFLNRFSLYPQMLRHLHAVISADILHIHDYDVFWEWMPFVLLRKLFGKKVFLTFHGWEGDFPPASRVVRKRKICERLAHGNICVGHFIEKWYGTNADFITYGGVVIRQAPGEKEDVVVFVGRLADDTGIISYLNAWRSLAPRYPDFSFYICGDGPLRERLEAQVAGEAIPRVHFLGFVDDVPRRVPLARVVFTSGYLGMLQGFAGKCAVIATYDNPLKKDYLEMIPRWADMFWICNDELAIVAAFSESLHASEKIENAFHFAAASSWREVKKTYYSLWKG